MLRNVFFGVIALVAAACSRGTPELSQPEFDAAHSVALDGVINAGKLIASSDDEASIKEEIKEQLMYTIGQFNGTNGVADARRTELSVIQKNARGDGRFDVVYAAKLFVSWPRERQVPAAYELVLPAAGTYDVLEKFFDAYGADENSGKKCLASEAHEVSTGIFWYYYRPLKSTCTLRVSGAGDPNVVTRFNIDFSVSAENTQNKFPEYSKVWEDGSLVVTAIFGKNEHGSTDNWDAGVAAYRELYNELIATYGTPLTNSLAAGAEPSVENDEVQVTFNTASGKLDAQLYLVDGIRSVDADFQAKYNERTKISDFVSYSGHSGLGANIRALARMGSFAAGQYQIFLVNGCDTFAYVDDALRNAHAAANPGFGPSKYFDLVTNAMPSYFHMNATSNMAVVNALVGKQSTYRQLLAGFDKSQRANVTGEDDNLWPAPFQ